MRKLGNKLANRKTSTASWANAGPKWVCVLCEADNESTAKNCIYCDTPRLEVRRREGRREGGREGIFI